MNNLMKKRKLNQWIRRSAPGTPLILTFALILAVPATSSTQTQSSAKTQYSESVLYTFLGSPDGAAPSGPLTLDAQGNIYGTTGSGGNNVNPTCNTTYIHGCGTVFKLSAAGVETVLYSFTGTGGDGAIPNGGLVFDAYGSLYGTTIGGGNSSCNPPTGCGTVFKIDSSGSETILYRFTGTAGDGYAPGAPLLIDAMGNLYGTTQEGGDLSCDQPYGWDPCSR